jgi:putative resolvase
LGVEIVLINQTDNLTYEEELTTNVLKIITVFSARLYGSRIHKNKQLIEELKNVSSQL